MELDQLKRIIEAALLASSQPLTLPQLSALFDEFAMPSHEELAKAIEQLREDCEGRGIELVEVASGFRFQVRRDVHAFVSRLWTERQSRYSRALLETLALIAYRQPITRAEIEQIRGVAVSTNIVRTLEERDWVRVVGYRDLPGKPALFGTTRQFLDYFNLKSLDELPPLAEIRDIEDLDPQLSLDRTDQAIAAVLADGIGEEDAEATDIPVADETETPVEEAHAADADALAANDAGDDDASAIPSPEQRDPANEPEREADPESTA
jgi:segregation and condensation protein B